ncbi:NUDIX domain-containing protein [Streptosporangium sp. NPDC051022]|uniref:NUDIX domain-containing protein n=1 Tax=Streptosporangium sp. NPDC051022 TaxID=3155752 RepID=UPI00343CCD9C
MTRIQFAQKAVITDGDKVLLVRKSSDDPHNPCRWELPGGRLKDTEGLDDHVKREVLEETGLFVRPGRLIHMWSWEMLWDGEPVRVVAVSRYCDLESWESIAPAREKDDFIDDQMWVARSDLLSMDIVPSQISTVEFVASDTL